MKKKHLLLILLIILIGSCKKDIVKLSPTMNLKKFSKVKTQKFNLDTISYLVIDGENGTKIHYKRKDFNVSENQKVILVLKELYDFEDLFFNNINTITDKNELLESSGVLSISFMTDDKKIKLKENSFLKIEIPEGRLMNNDIFSAKIDTLNKVEWVELNGPKAITQDIGVIEQRGRITVEVQKTDTISYTVGDYYKADSLDNPIFYKNQMLVENTIYLNTLGWINIDKYRDNVSYTSFELEIDKKNVDNFKVYTVYKNLNSFTSLFYINNSLKFDNVPYLKDSTSIITVGFKNDKIYADKVKLIENKKIAVNLKEIDSIGIRKMLQ